MPEARLQRTRLNDPDTYRGGPLSILNFGRTPFRSIFSPRAHGVLSYVYCNDCMTATPRDEQGNCLNYRHHEGEYRAGTT